MYNTLKISIFKHVLRGTNMQELKQIIKKINAKLKDQPYSYEVVDHENGIVQLYRVPNDVNKDVQSYAKGSLTFIKNKAERILNRFDMMSDADLEQLQTKLTKEISNAIKNFSGEGKDILDELLMEGNKINKEIALRQSEFFAVDALVNWAKSESATPTPDLNDALESYFHVTGINAASNKENVIGHREIAIGSLTIKCISQCNEAELHKIDNVKQQLASTLPNYLKEKFDQLEMY